MEWTELTPEQAAQHPKYGLGGWLVVFYALAVLGFVAGLVNLANVEMLRQFYGERYTIVLAAQIVQTLLYLPFIVLTPMRHPLMPRATIVSMWTAVAIAVLMTLYIGQQYMVIGTLITIGIVGLFNWYLNRSRRVNVTYRHRVRADEAIPGPAGGETPAA